MTELLLICAIGGLAIAFATTVARWLVQQPVGDPDLVHIADLVSDGVSRYLKRQCAVTLAVAGVLAALLFLVYGVAYQAEAMTAVSPREVGLWVALSLVLGAGLGVIAVWVAAWAGRHASARVAAGVRRSLDESLQIAIRGGAVSGVVALALSLLGLALLFLALYLHAGSFGSDTAQALARAPRLPMLMGGFALGAAFVALLSQLGGGLFGKLADLGADLVGKLEASRPEDEASNPAAIADLVGDNVGDGAPRAAGVFAAAVAESLATMLVAAVVYERNGDLPSVTAVVLFPLVARTLGLLAAWFGVMVVRTDDTEVPMNALSRGYYVTSLLYTVGAIGCARWLLGPHWIALGGCAALGSVCSLVHFHVVQYYSEHKYRPVRTLAEAARGGPTLATLRGMLTAVEGTSLLIGVVLATVFSAHYVGYLTGLERGGVLGIAIAVGGMLGAAPYVLAMDRMGSIVDTAGGIIEMTVAADRPDVRARARLLDAVGSTAKSFTKSLAAVTSGLACCLILAAFLFEVWNAGADQPAVAGSADLVDVSNPLLYFGAVMGIVVVLAFVWVTLRRFVGAGRDVVNELRVQLGAAGDPQVGSPLAARGGALSADLAVLQSGRGISGSRPTGASSSPLGSAQEDSGGGPPTTANDFPSGDGPSLGPSLDGAVEPADGVDGAAVIPRRHPDDDGQSQRRFSAGRAQLAFVEIVSRIALRGMLAPALVGLTIPVFVGLALRLLTTEDRVASSAEALVALLVVATIAGALGSLLFTNAGSAWDNAKKYIETGAYGGRYISDATARRSVSQSCQQPTTGRSELDNPTYVAAVISDTIGDPLKGVIGPAIQALVMTLAALALVFLPFFL
jgi:K(+)-stimulated pyrophosphate-energized sodium pump